MSSQALSHRAQGSAPSPRPQTASKRRSVEPMRIATRTTGAVDREVAGEPKMEVVELRAGFGKTEILRGLSLPIIKNQVTAIIGPSGCEEHRLALFQPHE